ncbi:MAG: hypothetical protein MJZ11_10505 [Lachnospiraceae bacterium]|nr:hypothetical protein [Lachnospiraceae bacterium]
MENQNNEDFYNKNGYVDVFFRNLYLWDLKTRDEGKDDTDHFNGYTHTYDGNVLQVRIFKCGVGDLNVVSESNPKIDKGIYAIFEKQTAPTIKLKSTLDIVKGGSVSYVVYDYLKGENNDLKISDVSDNEYVNEISIAKFKTNGKLTPGENIPVERRIVYGTDGEAFEGSRVCVNSNNIEFLVLPEPTLEGIDEDRIENVECASKMKLEVGFTAGDYSDQYYRLEGKRCDFGEYSKYESYYGVKYKWKYKKNGSDKGFLNQKGKDDKIKSAKELFDYDEDNDEDLLIPLCSLEEGATYEFYQCAVLTAFDGYEVESHDVVKSYKLKIAKSLDGEKLNINISQVEVCENDDLENVIFFAKYGENEDPKDYKLDKFIYSWKIAEEEGSGENEVSVKRNFPNVENDVKFHVSLMDGCGNKIEKETSIHVNKLPLFTNENIIGINENISVTKIDDGSLRVMGVKGRQCKLGISDSEKNKFDYFYSENNDGTDLVSIKGSAFDDILNNKTLYFYKRSKDGIQCLSKPVIVNFIGLSELEGNKFDITEIFVCPGSTLPELNANNSIATATMQGVNQNKMGYLWQYSTDQVSWFDMVNVSGDGGKTLFEKEGYNGTWEKEINVTTYIRRLAIPTLEDGTELDEYASNVLKVSIFTKPVLEFDIDGEIVVDKKCYGDTIKLSMSVSNQKSLDEQAVMRNFNKSGCISKYGYYDNLGEKGDSILKEYKSEPSDWKMEVKRNYNIRAEVEYCGEAISSKEYLVESYPMIDVTPIIGKCAIVGNEVEVKAVKDGCTCEIIRGETVYKAVDGASTAKILLEHQTEYKFDVHVIDNTTLCETVLKKSIKSTDIKERKSSVGIGPSGDATANKVCAGSEIEIRSAKQDGDYEGYSWSVDGKTVTGERDFNLKFTPSQAGKEYKVKRTCEFYDATELCYTVEDEIAITTYDPLKEPSIGLSTDSVCNGEKVEVVITANGGGTEGEYLLTLGGMTSEAVSKGASYKFVTDVLKADTTFVASVTDASCSNETLYVAKSRGLSVVVEKNLDFTLSTSPEFITEDDFKDDVITITVKCVGVEKGDKLYYSLNGGEEIEVTYNEVGFTVKMNLKDFEETSKVELIVRRVGKVSGCESVRVFEYKMNEGFDGGEPLLVGNGKENEIEVCGGSTVDLSISNVKEITFGGGQITEMTDVNWSWYKGNSRIKQTEEQPNFTVEVGSDDRTATYFAVFSGKDAGGTTRKISSNKFTIKTGEGVEIGRIHFSDFPTETFVEYCKNSSEIVTMATDFTGKVNLQWVYSTDDGKTWENVPETMNGNEVATTNIVNISVAELAETVNGKNVDKVYFRLKAIDGCKTESFSDNILLVRFKSGVSMPSPTIASTLLFGNEVELPDSLLFGRHYSHTDPYEFIGRGEVVEVGSLQRVNFKDLIHFGENSVDVVRSEKARISNETCYSDTLHYTFNIYQKLNTPTLAVNPSQDYYCAKDGEKKNLYLNKIVGGDTASYKTVWQYQMEGIDEWIAMDNGENYGVFNVTIGKIKENEDNEHQQQIIIKDLSQSIKVRAMLTCEGDYPGGYVSSNEVALNVYSSLKDGGIDFTKKEICYNTSIDTIKGFVATGGSGEYIYTWQKSVDAKTYENLVNGEANDPTFAPWNSGGKYNLKETTYFRRIVTDDVCRTSDTSEVKTVFVRDSFEILPEDVTYSRIVTNGSRARLSGVTDYSQSGLGEDQYVWWKTQNVEYQRSAVNKEVLTEALEVPDGDDKITVTYYAQALKGGCVSSNKLPLDIMVYNQTAGEIYIDGEDIDVKEKWICSGENGVSLLSSEHAMNAEFEWYYFIGSNESNSPVQGMRDGRVTVRVSTPEVNLDTTNVANQLKNTNGSEKYVRVFRVTKVTIDDVSTRLYGDTITIKIVPTLESVSNFLMGNGNALAGDLMIEEGKKDYCIEDEPNKILGNLDPIVADYWNDYRNLFGPWIYDKKEQGGFKTYFEYQMNNGEWIKDVEYDYADNKYAGMVSYTVKTSTMQLDGTYRVRRVMEDGCSSITSNEVLLSLFDDQLNPDTVTTYAFTPDMTMFNTNNAIKKGYEVGDSIVFMSEDRNLDLIWYSDPECTEIIQDRKSWCGIRLTEELANEKEGEGAYVYVRARKGDCLGEAVAVPFEFGTLSDGGTIYISDSIICHNGLYGDIMGETEAKGQYKAPEYRKMEWTYGWQYKRSSSDKAVWSTIPNEIGLGLSSDVINEYAATSSADVPLLIRRVATNDKGRVRYSNVLTLTRYSELTPGTLSLNSTSDKFCDYDELPYVKTTSASGGKMSGAYNVTWQYNVNNGEWNEFICIDSLYVGLLVEKLDRNQTNILTFRCLYSDECEEVASQNQQITLFRINEKPSIYQNNDSCNAEILKLVVYNDQYDKTYQWSAIYTDPNDETMTEKTVWSYVGEECMIVRNGMPTSLYAVRSEDNETKCLSDYFRFDVEMLPDLSQTTPVAPVAICPGSDLEIKGGSLSGGNGEKTYQWQMSSTGKDNDFADIVDATGNDLNLSAKYMKTGAYFRRIVVDMCHTDTSDVIFVDVRQKVYVSPEDLSFDDFKCPNGVFTAKVVAQADSTMLSEYWTLDNDTIFTIGKNFQMEGFSGDSMEYQFVHYLTDTTGLTCPSEAVSVYAFNKPSINKEENIISTDNYTPCNESQVKIEGSLLGGSHSEHIKYNWYVNGNEQIGEFKNNLRVTANDDMVIVRIADNGCVTDSSNVLHLEGQIVFSYDYANELSMEVTTDVTDSSVVINILGSKLFSEGYEFTGDGDMPNVASNNIVLPYKFDIYKDSLLGIMAKVPYCVRSLTINPLRGGVISFDGGDQLCGGEEVAPIVVTELEGGSGNPTYQWQYKNERTPDFINIDGATNKSYTPSAVDVATTYRRVAVDGIYKSISNELTISIRPMPTVALVDNSYSLEELSNLSLYYRAHSYYQWVDNMEMYLIDSAMNADQTHWQISYDQESWSDVAKDKDSLLLTDQSDVAYYRYVAINTCGADTSEIVKLEKRLIDPIEDDQIRWVFTDTFLCRNEQKRDYLRFNLVTANSQGSKNLKYMYSYRVESKTGAFVWKPWASSTEINVLYDSIFTENTMMEYYQEVRISEMDENGNKRIPSDNVVLYVTRHDTLRGTSITRAVNMKVNTFDATFAMVVEDGSEIRVGEKDVIQLKQGDRVRFIPKVTSNVEYGYGDLQYNWSLEQPLNKNYFSVYGGRNGIDGITSEKESPICYYYNGGYYPVSLKVTDGVCEKFISDTSLYIPENSLRRFSASMVLEDEMQEGDFKHIDYIDVFPTYVTEFVNVVSTGNATHNVMLVDEVGRILYGEKFCGSIQVPMSGCISGTYFIVVDELERFKVIKR